MNVVHEESLSTSNSDSTTFSKLVHTDEQIREIFSVDDLPWEDLPHRSLFLSEIDHFENILHLFLLLIMSKNHKIHCKILILS